MILRSSGPLPREDPDAAAAVEAAMIKDGVKFVRNAAISDTVCEQNKGNWTSHRPCHDASYPVIVINYADSAGAASSLSVDLLLVATGRRANTGGLDLAAANVSVDEKNGNLVIVDDHLRTPGNPDVFAVGDCATALQFTHVAGERGREREKEKREASGGGLWGGGLRMLTP